jgi:hypothetical protein
MLDDSKTVFDLANWPRMVERGGEVKKNHGGGEDNRADHESSIPMARCMSDEKGRSDERAEQPYAVADTVGDLFASGLHLLKI